MDSDLINLIRILSIPIGFIFWFWLINLIFSPWTKVQVPEEAVEAQLPPIPLPSAMKDAGNPRHFLLLWHGNGPQISFSYAPAQQSTNANKVVLNVRSAWKHIDGRRFLCGECLEDGRQAAFALPGIRSSIFVGDEMMSADEFFEKLCAGYFGESDPLLLPPKPVAPAKPATPPKAPPPVVTPKPKLPANPLPELDFHDTKRERRNCVVSSGGDINWRKEGVLSLSGYRVGKSKGRREETRRRILNTLLVEDDLQDIPDRAYALQWGAPGSWDRFNKILDSLKAFLGNAQKKDGRGGDYSYAIHDWKRDIAYLERLRPHIGRLARKQSEKYSK